MPKNIESRIGEKASCYPVGFVKDGKVVQKNKSGKMYWSKFGGKDSKVQKSTAAKKKTTGAKTTKTANAKNTKTARAKTTKKPATKVAGLQQVGSADHPRNIKVYTKKYSTTAFANVNSLTVLKYLKSFVRETFPNESFKFHDVHDAKIAMTVKGKDNTKSDLEPYVKKIISAGQKLEKEGATIGKNGPKVKIGAVISGSLLNGSR